MTELAGKIKGVTQAFTYVWDRCWRWVLCSTVRLLTWSSCSGYAFSLEGETYISVEISRQWRPQKHWAFASKIFRHWIEPAQNRVHSCNNNNKKSERRERELLPPTGAQKMPQRAPICHMILQGLVFVLLGSTRLKPLFPCCPPVPTFFNGKVYFVPLYIWSR